MKKILAALTAALTISTAADASTVAFGFKSVDGVDDGATSLTWDNGGINLIQSDTALTVEMFGLQSLTQPLTAWVVDWAGAMGSWDAFDIYVNPTFNPCGLLVTYIFNNPDATSKSPMVWDQANTSENGYCSTGEDNVTLTANFAVMPVPTGALLLVTGLVGFGALRRRSV